MDNNEMEVTRPGGISPNMDASKQGTTEIFKFTVLFTVFKGAESKKAQVD